MKKAFENSSIYILLGLAIIITLFAGNYIKREFIDPEKDPLQKQTYQEIYQVIKDVESQQDTKWGRTVLTDDLAVGIEEADIASQEADFSDTNIQVAGVQEADIIKTDGQYIYTIYENKLSIIDVADFSVISQTKLETEEYQQYSEMYYYEDTLVLFSHDSQFVILPMLEDQASSHVTVQATIFDVSDRKSPEKQNQLTQSGWYLSSRMIDNHVYIISQHSVYNPDLDEPTSFVPMTEGKERKPLAPSDIYLMPNPTNTSYITITSIDVNNPNDFVNTKAILGGGSEVYASLENIFVTGMEMIEEDDKTNQYTNIFKFKIDNGEIDFLVNNKVLGYILNQFSMDEYQGNFRLVTTVQEFNFSFADEFISTFDFTPPTNSLYVLDKDLEIISKIEGLAEEERVYSVRFQQEIVYFVTFFEIDPLFAVDLSDPENPIILSELKITGFSDYLHVFNEDYLFGLGKEADLEGRILGVKISMFDIRDKTDITEEHKKVIGDRYSWSEGSYNHKAILVSAERNLIGFPVSDDYYLYQFYEDEGFVKRKQTNFELDSYYGQKRGLYIDENLYVYSEDTLIKIDLEEFEETERLKIK